MAETLPPLGIIIVNYRTPALTIESLEAIADARAEYGPIRVAVVEGGSGDDSAARIADAIAERGYGDWATLVALPVNGGFAFANDQGLAALLAQGGPVPEFVCIVNPDARVLPGSLPALAHRLLAEPRAGAVGALLVHEDGSPQGSAFSWPTIRSEFLRGVRTGAFARLLKVPPVSLAPPEAAPVDWVTGAAVMFRTAALREVGFFDHGFFLYFEETELMHRLARGGWTIWHEPAARVVHLGGAATQLRDPATGLVMKKRMPRYWYEARMRYFARTGGRGHAVAAGLSWLAGRLIWQARCAITRRADEEVPRSTRDFAAFSLLPPARAAVAHVAKVGEPMPDRPAWMAD